MGCSGSRKLEGLEPSREAGRTKHNLIGMHSVTESIFGRTSPAHVRICSATCRALEDMLVAAEPIEFEYRLQLLALTFNVGNAPPPADVSELLPAASCNTAHIVAVGLQECAYYNKAHPVAAECGSYHDGTTRSVHNYVGALVSHLGDAWEIIDSVEYQEMKLVVFSRREHHRLISHIQTFQVSFFGIDMLHGALAVRCSIANTTLLFITSHLAAHEGEQYYHKRNDELSDICEELRSEMESADHILWMGDLNYRLDFGGLNKVELETARPRLEKLINECSQRNDWQPLWRFDEFSKVLDAGEVLPGFREAADMCRSSPTFLVEKQPGFTYNSRRFPAWCDRVVWRSLPCKECNMKHLATEALGGVSTSDHKPVISTFEIVYC